MLPELAMNRRRHTRADRQRPGRPGRVEAPDDSCFPIRDRMQLAICIPETTLDFRGRRAAQRQAGKRFETVFLTRAQAEQGRTLRVDRRERVARPGPIRVVQPTTVALPDTDLRRRMLIADHDRGIIEWRRQVRRGSVGEMMIDTDIRQIAGQLRRQFCGRVGRHGRRRHAGETKYRHQQPPPAARLASAPPCGYESTAPARRKPPGDRQSIRRRRRSGGRR